MIRLVAIAALLLTTADVAAGAQAGKPVKEPQPFRTLASTTSDPWQVAWIGNDEKVNHCALTRGTSSTELRPGEPKFMFVADREWIILRVRAAEFQFTEKKALSVTLLADDGSEQKPLAATGGPDLADIRFGRDRKDMDALLVVSHLDVRMGDSTVRLPFDRLAAVMPAFDECMANIGKPAKGWSDQEVDALINVMKSGRAKCVDDKRSRKTICEVD